MIEERDQKALWKRVRLYTEVHAMAPHEALGRAVDEVLMDYQKTDPEGIEKKSLLCLPVFMTPATPEHRQLAVRLCTEVKGPGQYLFLSPEELELLKDIQVWPPHTV